MLKLAQENKYLGLFWRNCFIIIPVMYVECTHLNCLNEAILMSTLNIPLFYSQGHYFIED